MGIKWKNSYSVFIATLLLVIGSMLVLSNEGRNVVRTETGFRLENELGPKVMLDYLKQFDEKSFTTEQVTEDLIEQYRHEYGDLEAQVQDITKQYRPLIKAAKDDKETELVTTLTRERDTKILDIISNYTNSQVVKEKIVKRDREKISKLKPRLINELEDTSIEYVNDNYVYYFTGANGSVLTNLKQKIGPESKEIKGAIGKETSLKVKKQSIWVAWPEELWSIGAIWSLAEDSGLSADGYVAVKKGSQVDKNNQKAIGVARQQALTRNLGWSLLIVGAILALSFIIGPVYFSQQGHFIQQIPLDIRLLGLAVLGFAAFITKMSEPAFRFRSFRSIFFFSFAYVGIFIGLCLVKNLWLAITKAEGYPDFPRQAQASLTYRWAEKGRRGLSKLPTTLKILGVLAYFGFCGSMILLIDIPEEAFLISGFLFLIGATPLVIREYRLRKVLKKPQAILVASQKEALPSQLLSDISGNLEYIDQIIKVTDDNRQRSESLKTELLTNVSHDLRTPLTSIISYGELLTQDKLKEADRQAYTAIINRKAMRMKNLIDDLFAVTKMNNGEITLNKKEINLGQLLEQAIGEYAEELVDKQLKMIYTQPEEPIISQIDGERMWRVFDNLIGNVVKYAMPHTRVYLKLEANDQGIKMELKNISLHELNEDASNLVERFTRGDEARNTDGSGLGLAIANSIITLHEGHFEITVDGDMFKIQIYLPPSVEQKS